MEELRLAFVGFGSANRALVRLLLEKSEHPPDDLRRRHLRIGGRLVPWRAACIVTRTRGRVVAGLLKSVLDIDLEAALQRVDAGQRLDQSLVVIRKSNSDCDRLLLDSIANSCDSVARETTSLLTLLAKNQAANIVVEAIPSNPRGQGEPALSIVKAALSAKMHVVSANKTSLAHRTTDGEEVYWKLQQIAQANDVQYKHESAVMDGVPLFSLWERTLPCAKLTSIRGCLNSTTTMILTHMEGNIDDMDSSADHNGKSFLAGLEAAKELGIVEEDESLDVDGYDAAVKLRALLVVLSRDVGTPVPAIDDIPRQSLRGLTREAIREAYADGRRKYRLVATAEQIDGTRAAGNEGAPTLAWRAAVRLLPLLPSDPLYNLSGSDASVTLGTNVLGPLTVGSANPTIVDTAYGLFSDILRVASSS